MGTTYYIWDEENDSLLEEVDDDGNVIASYTNEPGPFGKVISQERNGVTSVYHYDGQGSTVALTDENGNVTDRYVYSAFGELVSSTGSTVNPFRFVGQYGYYTDSETNDNYIRARSYKPSFGRWISRDPVGYKDSSVDLYLYVLSNPIAFVDPTGYQADFSDKGCCDAAKLFQLDLTVKGHSQAGVICCNNRKVVCLWVPGGRTNPNSPRAKDIVNDCTIAHENAHKQDITCDPCQALGRPGPDIPIAVTECHAYRDQIACIRAQTSSSCNQECQGELRNELTELEKLRDDFCQKGGVPPIRCGSGWIPCPPDPGTPPSPPPRAR